MNMANSSQQNESFGRIFQNSLLGHADDMCHRLAPEGVAIVQSEQQKF